MYQTTLCNIPEDSQSSSHSSPWELHISQQIRLQFPQQVYTVGGPCAVFHRRLEPAETYSNVFRQDRNLGRQMRPICNVPLAQGRSPAKSRVACSNIPLCDEPSETPQARKCRVLLQNPKGHHRDDKASYCSLSWASSMQLTCTQPISVRSFLISSFHLQISHNVSL
jgi:hypothetical protein